jgi:hypothetical protein
MSGSTESSSVRIFCDALIGSVSFEKNLIGRIGFESTCATISDKPGHKVTQKGVWEVDGRGEARV